MKLKDQKDNPNPVVDEENNNPPNDSSPVEGTPIPEPLNDSNLDESVNSIDRSDQEEEESVNKEEETEKKEEEESPKEEETKPVEAIKPRLIAVETRYDLSGITTVRLATRSSSLEWLYFLLSLMTIGILEVVNNWTKGYIKTKFIYKEEEELAKANAVIIVGRDGRVSFADLSKKSVYISKESQLETFVFNYDYQTYIWEEEGEKFRNVRVMTEAQKVSFILANAKNGQTEEDVEKLRTTFGKNTTDLKDDSLYKKITSIISKPVVVFQIVSLFVLFYLRYHAYFYFVLICLLVKLFTDLYKSCREFEKLRKSNYSRENVMVIRSADGKIHKKRIIDSSELVPGDLIELTNNLTIPADVVLIYGSCVVQNTFNGEVLSSQTKFSIEEENDFTKQNTPKRNMLYTGDRINYTINHINEGCFGVVVDTGFNTIKGDNLRTILNKKDTDFQYKKDAYILFLSLAVLAMVTALGLILFERFVNKKYYFTLHAVLSKIFQLFIITLKPTIPLALFAATAYSAKRLKKNGIVSNDLNKLNDVGKTKKFLVEQELIEKNRWDKVAFLFCKKDEKDKKVFDKTVTSITKLNKQVESKPIVKKYIECFGMCNIVTKLNEEYFGSSIEIEMLKNSVFDLNYKIGENGKIERVFEKNSDAPSNFSDQYKVLRYCESKNQENVVSSVVIQNKEGQIFLYSKGAPFNFSRKCVKNTIPANFAKTISKCAGKGYRCTALGYKKLTLEEVNQCPERLENGLTFLGFYLNKTEINQGVKEGVKTLTDIDIGFTTLSNSSVYISLVNARKGGMVEKKSKVYIGQMATIDSVNTVVWQKLKQKNKHSPENSILNEPVLINEVDLSTEEVLAQQDCYLALTGKAFRHLIDQEEGENNSTILQKCVVYGDLTADDRVFIVDKLKTEEQQITYVNTGKNNAELVKSVDVSIALNTTPLSAINSFAGRDNKLGKLVDIITEGRTNLLNKHKNFEFLCYFVALQFFGLLLLFSRHTNYSASQIFFGDILILLVICNFQASFGPRKLKKEVPCRSIFSHKFISTVLTFVGYGAFWLWFIAVLLWKTKFYKTPSKLAKKSHNLSADAHLFFEPFVVFVFSVLLSVRFVVSINADVLFNRRVFKNLGFLLYVLCLMTTPFVLLFAGDLAFGPTRDLLKILFRIPNLHGFEFLVVLLSVVMLIGFYFVNWAEKNFIRKWTWKYRGVSKAIVGEVEETVEMEKALSVKTDFSDDSNGYDEEEVAMSERKKRAERLRRSFVSKSRSRRSDDDSFLNESMSVSRIDVKSKQGRDD